MNFILFTNQGYPLQNSSLGQLQSDVGIVSIVCSSAWMLLLEYLSARRLCSSGYYPKYQNGALSNGFWAGGIERSHRDWDPVNRGAEEPQECFFCQKFIDGDCRATWGVVAVQRPIAFNAWSHMCHPFPQSFKDFSIKSWIDSLSWWHKFLLDDPLTVKKTNEHWFDFGFAHSHFLWTGRVCSVPLPTLAFCLGVVPQNPWSITCDNATEDFWLPLKAVQKIKTHIPPIGLLLSSRFFGTILAHTFLMSKSCVKIWWTVNQFKFNSLLIILNVNWQSDLTRDLTLSTLSYVFEVEGLQHEVCLPLVLGFLKRTCAIWTLVPWIGNVLHKPFVTFHKSQ